MRLSRHNVRLSLLCAPSLVFLATACNDFDTSRATPTRGTTGEELFGVICDRVGAQALREDLTGASVHGVCHKDAGGNYADAVDESVLPPPSDDLKDTQGNPVSIDDQTRNRAYALARIGALVRDRGALIEAFDAMFPEVQLSVKDTHNPDATKSCDPAQGDKALRTLGKELSDLLGRLTPLYDDGTIPSSTESLGRIASNFQATPDAQSALAHLSARNGYRPLQIALGMIRPIMAYNGFRDFSAQSLRIFSSDSDPFNPNPQHDSNGHRIQTPGSAYAQLSELMEAMHEELRTSTADPILPPLAVDGTCLSLRALRPASLDLAALDAQGALPGGVLAWLEAMLAAPLAVLVTGATGAGKTTLLGALLGALDPELRVLVVEDATELAPAHPHVVRLQSRPPNVEGAGAVPLRDLLRQALRMRPDRLVLGEVRGAEVVDLLVALNTGHEGGLSTVHANSPAEVPARLEALGALAGLRRDALHSLVAAAVHAVVHCARGPSGRRVAQIAVLDVVDRDVVVTPALIADAGSLRPGPGLARLRRLLTARGVPVPALA